MKIKYLVISSILLFTSCAQKSANIKPTYIPTIEYEGKTCRELKNELIATNRELRVIAGIQDDTASNDKIAMGVGLVVFWPALFLLANGDDNKRKISELKGRYSTITEVATKKGCRFVKQL